MSIYNTPNSILSSQCGETFSTTFSVIDAFKLSPQYRRIANKLQYLRALKEGKPLFVGIAGQYCAGKTSMAIALQLDESTYNFGDKRISRVENSFEPHIFNFVENMRKDMEWKRGIDHSKYDALREVWHWHRAEFAGALLHCRSLDSDYIFKHGVSAVILVSRFGVLIPELWSKCDMTILVTSSFGKRLARFRHSAIEFRHSAIDFLDDLPEVYRHYSLYKSMSPETLLEVIDREHTPHYRPEEFDFVFEN